MDSLPDSYDYWRTRDDREEISWCEKCDRYLHPDDAKCISEFWQFVCDECRDEIDKQ